MNKKRIVLFLILLLGFFLRFYRLDKNPPSLYWDEVSIGYNAFSIIKTFKDEWGRASPWFFEAFGEFKFPVSIYLTAISVFLFGLTDFAVRFPSAFFGMLSIGAIYLLSFEIFRKRKPAIIAAFLLSISPWHIQFSRGMFESNISFCFFILAVYFLILFIRQNTKKLFISFFVFAFLSIYSYATMLLILPFSSFVTVFLFKKEELSQKVKKGVLISSFLVLILFPFVNHIQKDSYVRFNQVSIFTQNETLEKIINLRLKYGGASKIVFNQYSAALINFTNNLKLYLNPQFLWPGRDGNPRHENGFGLIYPQEFIFLILGIILLLSSKKKTFGFFLFLILIPFSVSSLTKDSPHALRSLSAVLPLIMISAYGIFSFTKKTILKILVILSYAIFISAYLSSYFGDYLKNHFSSWGMENKLMMGVAKKYNLKNKIIYFTGDYWRPYIYYYYYFQTPPQDVQKNNNSSNINNVYFGYAKWDKADRRYDFNFKPESLFSKNNLVLFLSPSEKEYFSKLFEENGIHLKRDFYYNKSYLFSIYEK